MLAASGCLTSSLLAAILCKGGRGRKRWWGLPFPPTPGQISPSLAVCCWGWTLQEAAPCCSCPRLGRAPAASLLPPGLLVPVKGSKHWNTRGAPVCTGAPAHVASSSSQFMCVCLSDVQERGQNLAGTAGKAGVKSFWRPPQRCMAAATPRGWTTLFVGLEPAHGSDVLHPCHKCCIGRWVGIRGNGALKVSRKSSLQENERCLRDGIDQEWAVIFTGGPPHEFWYMVKGQLRPRRSGAWSRRGGAGD